MTRFSDFLRAVTLRPTEHLFVCGPSELGILRLLPVRLEKIAPGSVSVYDAKNVTADIARHIAAEVHRTPANAVPVAQVVVHGAEMLSKHALPPFLSAMEEPSLARFVIHATHVPQYLGPIVSRCRQFRVPFLKDKTVLANMQALHLDAREAEDLCDGTLEGTIQRLAIKDALAEIEKQLGDISNLPAILNEDGFDPSMLNDLTSGEREFLLRSPTQLRQKLVLFLIANRRSA